MDFFKKISSTYRNSSTVFKASLWFLAVTIIDKGIAVITQPIVNRIMNVDEVGTFGVYHSWYSIFSVLATFNLFGGILEVSITKQKNKSKEIVSSLCALSIMISLIFWVLMLSFGNSISALLGLKKGYLFLMAISIISEAVIQFWAVPKRFEYSYKVYAVVIIAVFFTKSVLSVLGALYFVNDRVMGRIFGLTLPSFGVALILLLKLFRNTNIKNITFYWKRGLLFNLPLIPHYLSSILLSSSDRVMIQKLANNSDAGLYTVAYSYASLTLIVFSALNNAYNPLSMKAIKDKNYKKLSEVTEIMIILSVMFSIFMMLLAPEGIWLLGGKKYMITSDIIPVLIVGIFFSSFYFVFSNVEFVYEKNKLIFPITLVGASLNIGLNFFMIQLWGYKVAAYTTFVGYLFIAISHYIISRRIIGKDIFNIKKLAIYILLLICGGIGALLLYNCHYTIRYMFTVLLMIILFTVVFKKKNSLLKMIVKKDSVNS